MPMMHEQMKRNRWHTGWDINSSSNQRGGNVFEEIRADERVLQFIGSVNANKSPVTQPVMGMSSVDLKPKPSALSPRWENVVRVIVWLSLSMCVVLSNKWLVDELDFAFREIIMCMEELPESNTNFVATFLATCHMLFGTLVSSVMRSWTGLFARKTLDVSTRQYLHLILPVALFLNLSIICGNEAMAYLSITMIQTLKGTSPITVYLTSLLLGMSRFETQRAAALFIISVGICVASYRSIQTSWYGVSVQLMGVGSDSLRLVLMQKILDAYAGSFDPSTLFYHLTPACAFLGAMFTLFTAVPSIVELVSVWRVLLLNCALTSALNLTGLVVIKNTSSLSLSVCGILKDVFLITASWIIWRTSFDLREIVGYLTAVGGLFLCGRLSMRSRD
ncbi:hypothetical protein KXV52_009353 [Aspergillus fumigatus]|nr:hypothetical protein KXX30_005352 [Aspergillus fumigatus]KAH1401636.1 hypothetical protein KXX51_003455 [Aspergillus fumigatus]KAH1438702.1 hypothetical protein KXX68_006297 [Aspergillus fumigatus]KAH1536351.1 hypothetical protein KXX37_005980 [Aspergillus fumigatus]KAH1714442.1 hypothetical protein KXX60_004115 [Aspergillus fumigatus]